MHIKRVLFPASILVALSLIICSCAQKYAPVEVVLCASKSTAQTLVKELTKDPAVLAKIAGVGLDSGQYVSFTPSSFKMYIDRVELFTAMVPVSPDKGGEGYISGGQRITIPVNQVVDILSGANEINELLTKSINAKEEEFGTYIGVCLSVNLKAHISGSITLKGKVYSFTDKEVTLNNPSFDYLIPSTSDLIVVSDTVTSGVVLRLLLDAENCGTLSRYSGKWYNSGTENSVIDSDDTKLLTPWPILMPYVGHTPPEITRYRLTFSQDALSYPSFYLQLTIIGPTNDIISAIGSIMVFSDSYNDRVTSPFTNFLPYQKPIITRINGGAWTIAHNPKYYPPGRYGGLMKLNAFRLENHSGTIAYDPGNGKPEETWHYTAEKL